MENGDSLRALRVVEGRKGREGLGEKYHISRGREKIWREDGKIRREGGVW